MLLRARNIPPHSFVYIDSTTGGAHPNKGLYAKTKEGHSLPPSRADDAEPRLPY